MRPPLFYRRFDYRRSLLPNAHLAALEEGVTSIEEARERSGATIGYPGWNVIYSMLLSSLSPVRPQTLIETGTNYGCSTIILAQALEDVGVDGVVHTFEIEPDVADIARKNIEKAGLTHRVVHHLGDSRETLPAALEQIDGDIDGAFLDGSHAYHDAMTEFDLTRARVRRGGLIFFDNTYPIGETEKGEDTRVNGVLKDLAARKDGHVINMQYASWYTPGLAVWQATPPLEEQDWER